MPFYPPSSPPLASTEASPARRALLPSFEAARKHNFSSSTSPDSSLCVRTPSRKRVREDIGEDAREYPTPAPTSSAVNAVSSPTAAVSRALLSLSDEQQQPLRAPLSTVALARLRRSGSPVSLGRSSNSSSVVLSRTNKLISRVHVVTQYVPERDTVCVQCEGWNGARVGTPGREYALAKGENVEIDARVPIIIDVCGERARVEVVIDHEEEEDEEETDDEVFVKAKDMGKGELSRQPSAVEFTVWEDSKEASKDSQIPAPAKQIEENVHKVVKDVKENEKHAKVIKDAKENEIKNAKEIDKQVKVTKDNKTKVREVKSELEDTHLNSQQHQQAFADSAATLTDDTDEEEKLRTHIIAHLAYSRLASTPLSSLRTSLPIVEFVSDNKLRSIISNVSCIGIIPRRGKDASGKRLEEQYYYIPEQDSDLHRRAAVEELRGVAGIRSCRKVHKQYFWRKPAAK
ncbi:uncharacterized protein V2V93DRAFT_372738 [Kockiozyma suomiensis]|uniref:uncharacterized protein n=1 Tax=Kockiozyma suomiensis TaxID=1337062 RepID=UPI00334321CF